MKAIIIAEHADAATELAAGARTLADEVVACVLGAEETPASIADAAYHLAVPEGAVLDDADASLSSIVDGADIVISEPTRRLKTVIGKLAAQAGASVITDALSIEDGVATTMFFGGLAQSKRKATGATTFYTVGAGVFAGMSASGDATPQELEWVAPERPLKELGTEPIVKSGVDLNKVDVVVACGRGFTDKEDLNLAYEITEKVNGGLGCTRPLSEGVDWFPTESYIGVSGLMLAPKVYISLGISGQMQHMVGVNRADKVFAINKDKNAPIFKQCDFGLVGDVKTVLPALIAELS